LTQLAAAAAAAAVAVGCDSASDQHIGVCDRHSHAGHDVHRMS